MFVTLPRMVIEVRPLQREKAHSPILVTPFPIVTEVRPEQLWNAASPMLVTLLGIVIEVRLLHAKKALFPMLVTLLGMVVFWQPDINVLDAVSIIALQLSRESYFVFPDFTLIEVRPLQPPKAASPMLVTLLPMVIEVRPLQYWNVINIDNQ